MHGDQICLDQRLFVLNVVTSDLSSAVYIDMYLVIAFTLFAIVMQADSVIICAPVSRSYRFICFSSDHVVRTDVNISTVRKSSTLNHY